MVKLTGYLAGERKTNRKRSNVDGFDKRDTLRWRERRDLNLWWWWSTPKCDGLAGKARPKFNGNLAVPNFGVRFAGLRVAARKTGCTSRILTSRRTPAYIYIYTRRVGRFWKVKIF